VQRSGVGVDGFLNTCSLINEHSSSDSETFDGGRDECFQKVSNRGWLGRVMAVIYLEFLDVW